MNQEKINIVYFIGIGGIGMSALARYYLANGMAVEGYDLTPTPLTKSLQDEGANIHFEDNPGLIPENIKAKPLSTLVIYTPAIPPTHAELNYFRSNNFNVIKRSDALGEIVNQNKGIAIAGTHGKTTVSTMVAFLLKNSALDCSAFLGGISSNFNSNLVLSAKSEYVVVEADEFDRTFLKLKPHVALVTSVDSDHLDIYADHDDIKNAFREFTLNIEDGGTLIVKKEAHFDYKTENIQVFSYSLEQEADFYPANIMTKVGKYYMDLNTPFGLIKNISTGMPGLVNLENTIAAIAVAKILDVGNDEIVEALKKFKGVKRRFDIQVKNSKIVYIDDYAHHPEELKHVISSVRQLYKEKKITGIFQPHLFSRTRDFAKEFAKSLDLLDEVILLDIYPAREAPIPGVTSNMIFEQINRASKSMSKLEVLMDKIKHLQTDVLLTLGAGNIDKYVEPIKQELANEEK